MRLCEYANELSYAVVGIEGGRGRLLEAEGPVVFLATLAAGLYARGGIVAVLEALAAEILGGDDVPSLLNMRYRAA